MNSEELLKEEFKLKDSIVKDSGSATIANTKFNDKLSAADLYKIIVSM